MQIYTIPFAAKSGDSFSVCLADRQWERVDECRNISKQRRGREKEPEDSSAKSEGHCAKAERAGSEWAEHQSPNGTKRAGCIQVGNTAFLQSSQKPSTLSRYFLKPFEENFKGP